MGKSRYNRLQNCADAEEDRTLRILLTGATGFLGNNLLRILLEDGHQVTATYRQQSDPRPFRGLSVDQLAADLNDFATLKSAVANADLVIHVAAMIQIGWSKLEESRKVNVEATRHLAQAARLQGIRMIHVSTVDALSVGHLDRPATELDIEPAKPGFSYVVSKREAELAFAEQVAAGLDGVIVSPGFMVGPWDWKPSSGQMMLAIAKQFTPLAPSGGCTVVDVRDVACGIVSAIEHGKTGESYILGGENVTYLDLWKRMAKVVGSRPPVGKLPSAINWTAGRVGDLIGKLSGNEPTVNSAATKMGSLIHWYSSQKAVRELGYQIGDVDIALADAWDWFKTNGYC